MNKGIAAGMILFVAATSGLEAQGIGGLIKRKAAEAVKPKEEPKTKATDAAEPSSPFAFDLTPESMAALKRGLELEIKMRADYRAEVARQKTVAQYKACESESASSPEAAKYMEEYLARQEKVKTQEDVQKLTAWQNETLNAIVKKKCGDDPQPLIDKQMERFTKAQFEGAIEFAKAFRKPAPRHDAGNREQDDTAEACQATVDVLEDGSSVVPSDGSCEHAERADPLQEQPNASTDPRVLEYLKTLELVVKYCSLSPAMRADAERNGIQVPGEGKNIYWVFTRAFAIWVGPDCEHLIKLYTIVTSK